MRWIGVLVAMAVLAGCTPAQEEPAVGRLEVSWHQEDDDPVGLDSGVTLLRDEVAWQAWLDALPADMRQARADDLARVFLDDSVKVVAVWGMCRQTSSIHLTGPGELDFRITALDDPPALCAWSPVRVQVWSIGLDAVGAGRHEVRLLD